MKFIDIIQINENLNKLKELNKTFDLETGLKLIHNLDITEKIITKQNEKLNKLLEPLMIDDGYDMIIKNENIDKFNEIKDNLNNEDFNDNLNIIFLSKTDLTSLNNFDLTTIELIKPLLKITDL